MASPIEQALSEALRRIATSERIHLADYTEYEAAADLTDTGYWSVKTDPLGYGQVYGVGLDTDGVEQWSIFGNVQLLTYRVDLFIQAEYGQLVVECDGHDFHDRTKQQAAYDRSRDRELLLAGLVTVRYTGSEIHHSPDRCAREVVRIARALSLKSLNEWNGRRG